MELSEIFKKNKPNLSESSVKQYVGQLRKMAKKIDIEVTNPQDVVDSIDKVVEYVKNIGNKNTRKSYASMLIVFLKEKDDKFVKELRNIMISDINDVEAENIKQKLNGKQMDNFVDWDEVMSTYLALSEHAQPLFEKQEHTKREWTVLLTYVLMTMLTAIPPRRSKDYINFKLKNIDKEKDNFSERSNLVFNSYKTAKTYGQQKVPSTTKMRTMLTRWKRINGSDWLLPQYKKNEPITGPQLTRLLNDLFDKNVSTSMLRHSYLSHVYKDVPKIQEFEEMAKKLGTSREMILENYVKHKE